MRWVCCLLKSKLSQFVEINKFLIKSQINPLYVYLLFVWRDNWIILHNLTKKSQYLPNNLCKRQNSKCFSSILCNCPNRKCDKCWVIVSALACVWVLSVKSKSLASGVWRGEKSDQVWEFELRTRHTGKISSHLTLYNLSKEGRLQVMKGLWSVIMILSGERQRVCVVVVAKG